LKPVPLGDIISRLAMRQYNQEVRNMKRKSTIRKYPPVTRKFAKAVNNLDSAIRRLNNIIPQLADMESENIAWQKRQDSFKVKQSKDPIVFGETIEIPKV
jgi:division protein CdvB (Snf7/Vps24/ESCRT-III family)